MKFTDGIEQSLLMRDLPIITFCDFFILGHKLFSSKVWNGEPLKYVPNNWDQRQARNTIKQMEKRRSLVFDSDFRSNVWRITQSIRTGPAEEIVCIADPFAYVSHLSAMHTHSLTNRSPKALHLTTPTRGIWNKMQGDRVREHLPEIKIIEKPILNYPGFKDTIRRRPVVFHASSHPWTPLSLRGENTRVTSIGQTFADMLSEPSLCGGMRHVLDVWERDAVQWILEITEAIDQMDSKIAKVKAGYILSEVVGIEHPAIKRWEQFAQRGGSRKLDPAKDYFPSFSERWMISLNVL